MVIFCMGNVCAASDDFYLVAYTGNTPPTGGCVGCVPSCYRSSAGWSAGRIGQYRAAVINLAIRQAVERGLMIEGLGWSG
jgi:hypothetical protein